MHCQPLSREHVFRSGVNERLVRLSDTAMACESHLNGWAKDERSRVSAKGGFADVRKRPCERFLFIHLGLTETDELRFVRRRASDNRRTGDLTFMQTLYKPVRVGPGLKYFAVAHRDPRSGILALNFVSRHGSTSASRCPAED